MSETLLILKEDLYLGVTLLFGTLSAVMLFFILLYQTVTLLIKR
jgi:hypothetical protein